MMIHKSNDPIGEHDRHELTDINAVNSFSLNMIEKLRLNKHKAHWITVDNKFLTRRLKEECEELFQALKSSDSSSIISECADVANLAMMIADNQ